MLGSNPVWRYNAKLFYYQKTHLYMTSIHFDDVRLDNSRFMTTRFTKPNYKNDDHTLNSLKNTSPLNRSNSWRY